MSKHNIEGYSQGGQEGLQEDIVLFLSYVHSSPDGHCVTSFLWTLLWPPPQKTSPHAICRVYFTSQRGQSGCERGEELPRCCCYSEGDMKYVTLRVCVCLCVSLPSSFWQWTRSIVSPACPTCRHLLTSLTSTGTPCARRSWRPDLFLTSVRGDQISTYTQTCIKHSEVHHNPPCTLISMSMCSD